MGYGLVFVAAAVLVAIQLYRLETGDAAIVRLWWPVAILYRALGFWGAIACPSIFALAFFGWGTKRLVTSLSK